MLWRWGRKTQKGTRPKGHLQLAYARRNYASAGYCAAGNLQIDGSTNGSGALKKRSEHRAPVRLCASLLIFWGLTFNMSRREILHTRVGDMLELIDCHAIVNGAEQKRIWTFDEAINLR